MKVQHVRHAWISEHLGWQLTGEEPLTVRSISHSDGTMGSVDRIDCAGRSFVFKGPPGDSSTWGNLLTDMGHREVQTYRLLASRGPSAPKVAPTCHWSALIGDGLGALALEDLGLVPDLSATMATGLSREQALAAVRCLALVHAPFAVRGGDALAAPQPWLYTAASAGLVDAVRLGLDGLPDLLEYHWPGRFDPAAVRAALDVDVKVILGRSNVGAPYVSLCHGDAWAGNILFASAGPSVAAYLIDWQFAMWGNPLSDVAMLLMSSLTPNARAAWHDALFDVYHATLTSHGLDEVTLSECHAALRQVEPAAALVALATLHGFTAGMTAAELACFAPRVTAAIEAVASATRVRDS